MYVLNGDFISGLVSDVGLNSQHLLAERFLQRNDKDHKKT